MIKKGEQKKDNITLQNKNLFISYYKDDNNEKSKCYGKFLHKKILRNNEKNDNEQ